MRRLAALAVIVAAAAFQFSSVSAAPASHWTDLNAALAPVNVALATDAQAFGAALAQAGADAQELFGTSLFDFSGQRDLMVAFGHDLDAVQAGMEAVQKDAKKGIAVLDSFAPEACSAHFTGTEYTMFLSWSLSMSDLAANQRPVAFGTALFLGGFNGTDLTRLPAGGVVDLEWNRVTCAGHVARPTAAPSAAASGG